MHWIEAAAVLLVLLSVVFQIRENIWGWPTTIAGAALYIIVFWLTRLYADMGLQFIYIALGIYGWYEWLHGGEGRTERKVTNAPRRVQLVAYGIGAAAWLVLAVILRRTTNAALPFVDSALTSYSLVAQWMLTRKYLENWILWIIVDVAYVAMYIFKDLYLTAGLYAFFIILCVAGYMQWKRSREVVVASGS